MSNPTPTGQDEARRALADRHLILSESVRSVVSRRRQELGLSLQQVADRSGLTKAHVWEVEQGRSRNVCISSIVGLANGLGVSECELLGLSALRAPSLDRGAEEMRERAAKVCEDEATACLGDITRVATRFPDMTSAERGDNLAHARASSLFDAAGDIRALPVLAPQSVLAQRAEEMEDRLDRYEDALHDIQRWSEAYPLSVFPEPDLKKAQALLEAGGMTLDSISAYCMRHVVEGVGKIARRALPVPADLNEGWGK